MSGLMGFIGLLWKAIAGGTPSGVIWDDAHKTPAVTLSSDKLTMSTTGGSSADNGMALATLAHTTGKWYYEIEILAINNAGVYGTPSIGAGVIVGFPTNQASGNQTGGRSDSWAIFPDGKTFAGGSYGANSYGGFGVGSVVQVAIDMDAGKLWFGVNGTFNGSPAAGTSEAFSGLSGKTIFPEATCGYGGGSLRGRFKSSAFSYSPPSGFLAWDQTAVATGVTWNPADKASAVSLSEANLLATTASDASANGFNQHSVRGTTARSTGKYYFEIHYRTQATAAGPAFGIATSGASLEQLIGYDSGGWSLLYSGEAYHQSQSSGLTGTFNAGSVVMVAADFKNGSLGSLWFGVNGTWLQGDPAAGTNPVFGLLNNNGGDPIPYFPAVTPRQSGQMRGRFTAADLSYAPPSGFLAWDGTAYSVPQVGFNPDKKSSSWTLANSNKSASGPANGLARSFAKSGGRRYVEIMVTDMPPIANPSPGVFVWPGWFSVLRDSIGLTDVAPAITTNGSMSETSRGDVYVNGTGTGSIGQASPWTTGSGFNFFSLAIDCDTGGIWFHADSDPTGENGWQLGSRGPSRDAPSVVLGGSGPIALQIGADSTASGTVGITLWTKASEQRYSPPNGFIAWDDVPGVLSGWDPSAFSSPNGSQRIALQSNNKKAVTTTAGQGGVIGGKRNTGKRYFEIKAEGGGNPTTFFGLVNTSVSPPPDYWGSSPEGSWFYCGNNVLYRTPLGSGGGNLESINANDVIRFSVDFDGLTMTIVKNTTTEIINLPLISGVLYAPAFYQENSQSVFSATLATTAADFTYPVPSGFIPWND